jgi:uncharacterized membrane protein
MSRKFSLFLAFTVFLSLARPFLNPGYSAYLFLLWNLSLAAIPFFIAITLPRLRNYKLLQFGALGLWLLFFPNAPYILTDLIHLDHSKGFDWYDTILILCAGIAGVKFAFDSLDITLYELKLSFPKVPKGLVVSTALGLASFGVYLGRYLRYNSWDVLTKPKNLLYSCFQLFRNPMEHKQAWLMIGIFGSFLFLLYQIWPNEKQKKGLES